MVRAVTFGQALCGFFVLIVFNCLILRAIHYTFKR
jgi:hypothetical protein